MSISGNMAPTAAAKVATGTTRFSLEKRAFPIRAPAMPWVIVSMGRLNSGARCGDAAQKKFYTMGAEIARASRRQWMRRGVTLGDEEEMRGLRFHCADDAGVHVPIFKGGDGFVCV